jgi:hypothetical protein
MISKGTNNKQQNQTAIPCDAGSVVMGRTADNGEYKILKLNPDGSINNNNLVTGGNYSINPAFISVPDFSNAVVDAYLGNAFLGNPFVEGIYNLSPFCTLQTNNNSVETINIFLVLVGSPLDNYFNTLTPISDNFAPSPTNIFGLEGLVEFWHAVSLQNMSNITLWKTTNQANLQRSVYLANGDYKLYITAHSPFIYSSGQMYLSCTNIQKIG